jgi:hypothetical protein
MAAQSRTPPHRAGCFYFVNRHKTRWAFSYTEHPAPVKPLIASSDYEYGMFEHFRRYPWVLDTYQYDSLDELLDILKEKVIDPPKQRRKS